MIKIQQVPKSFIQPEKILPEEYIFGSQQIVGLILRPSGQWPLIRDDEVQAKRFETNSCTSFGTINSVQSIFKELFKLDINYSERFLAKGSGTDPNTGGNDPHKVAEWARKNGFVDEAILPFDDSVKTIDDYYATLPNEALKKGQEWLNKWVLKHDWLSDGSLIPTETLMKALRYSPLGVAVYAWAHDEEKDLYVRPEHAKDIHWCEMVGYKENEYWLAIDSYSPFVKKLDWNFGFYFAKRYYISEAEKKTSISANLIKSLIKLFEWLKSKIIHS